MFENTFEPVALHIGALQIRWYGIIFVLGFVILLFYLEWLRKSEKTALSKEQIYDLVFYLIIGVVVGARLFHTLVWEPSFYLSSPIEILKVWKGGLSFHGGVVGVVIAGICFSRKHKVSFWHIADIAAIPAAFGLALGRVANFINGELWGTLTNVPWCVKFQAAEGCRHPVQIYAAIGRFLTGVFLAVLNRKKFREGFIFLTFIFLMGVGRFFTDFLREDARYWGLSTGQYLSIAMMAFSAYFLVKNHSRGIRGFGV